MFGRRGRKARTAQATEVQMAMPAETAQHPANAAPGDGRPVAATAPHNVELDATFMAMVAQLDDSLAAMARACDRIEQAVAGASRHHPAEADTVAAA